MRLTGLDLFFWTAGFMGHLILLLILCKRHRVRDFPIFAAWITSNVARTVVLALIARYGGKSTYYYVYWGLAVVDTSLQFGVVYEMYMHTFRPLGVWAKDVHGAFIGVISFSLAVAALLTAMAKPDTKLVVQEITIRGDLFASVWMSELFVAMTVICVKVGLPWKAHVARISQGLGIYSLFGVLIEAGNSYFGLDRNLRMYFRLSHLRMAVYLICLAYWAVMLWRNAPQTRELAAELRHKLETLQMRTEYELRKIRTGSQR